MDAAIALAPTAGMCLNMIVQVATFRHRRLGFYHSALAGFVAGGALIAVMLSLSLTGASSLDGVCWSLLVAGGYCGLGFGYFIFVNLSQTSVHIRMVRELAAAPGQTLTVARLLGEYGADQVLDARLERLLANGQLVRAGDRYLSGPRSNFLQLARVLDIFKLALLGKRTLFAAGRSAERRSS